MIEYVFKDRVKVFGCPHKFEAGTANVGGATGLMEAINSSKDMDGMLLWNVKMILLAMPWRRLQRFLMCMLLVLRSDEHHG